MISERERGHFEISDMELEATVEVLSIGFAVVGSNSEMSSSDLFFKVKF